MGEIVIPGRVQRTYQGSLVAAATSRRDEYQPKWAEFALYKLDDGRWLVHRTGKSVVYHRGEPGHVTGSGRLPGDKTGTWEDLPDDALPCRICRPPYPDVLADGEQVRIETDRDRSDVRDTPEEVIRLLATNDRGGHDHRRQERVEISAPVAELLEKAAKTEPRFAAVIAA